MNMNAEQISSQLAGNKSGIAELRSRLLFVMFALLVYRIGTHIPVPGIDPSQLQALFNQNQGGILELFNMFSGGAWERMSILALGVIPYITASIIMNLLTMMYPTFMQWKKEGGLSKFRKSESANGNILDLDGNIISCQHGARNIIRIDKKGKAKVLADKFNGKRFNSPNDVAV